MRDCSDTQSHINSWDRPERIVALHKAGLQRLSWMSEFPSVDPVAPYHAPEQRQRQQPLHPHPTNKQAAQWLQPVKQAPGSGCLRSMCSAPARTDLYPAMRTAMIRVRAISSAPQPDAPVDIALAPSPASADAATAAVPNDLVAKEELRRALLLHLQAPAVSESQQAMFKNYEYRNAFSPEPPAVIGNDFLNYSSSSSGTSSSADAGHYGHYNKRNNSSSNGCSDSSQSNYKTKTSADNNKQGPRHRRHRGGVMTPTLFKKKGQEMKDEGASSEACAARCLCAQGDDLEDGQEEESKCGLIEEGTKQDVFSPRARRGCGSKSNY